MQIPYTVKLREEGFFPGIPSESYSRTRMVTNWRGETIYRYDVAEEHAAEFEQACSQDWRVKSWGRMEEPPTL